MTTIHDVARRAGVSPVTVSRVINGANNVNPATREKVELAIQELGYLPNLAARSLRSRQTSTLALIVPDITNAFWTTVARGVEDAAQSGGYLVWLCNTDENLDKQTGYINAVLQQRVDGVMIAPYDTDAAHLRQLREHNTPTVVLDRDVQGWEVDTVRSDSLSGAYALVQHLIGLGHRRIAIISGPSGTSTAEERVAGYCLALEDAGIPIDPRLIRRGEYRTRSGSQLTDGLFDERLNPTAIVAANNVIATGVFEALQARGKTVPRDVALVCFDELPDLARFFPFLTVAVQPAYDMGINAAQLLLSRITADAPLQPRRVILPTRLVLRESCGRFLKQGDGSANQPPLGPDRSETVLIRPPEGLDEQRIRRHAPGLARLPIPRDDAQANTGRLHKALHHQPPGRLPHLEAQITSRALVEYVLERSLPAAPAHLAGNELAPSDLVAFAQRVGLDAVACEIEWRAEASGQEPHRRGRRPTPPPSLADHFTRIETYLRAARASGVGVYLSLPAFYNDALKNLAGAAYQSPGRQDGASLPVGEHLLDLLAARQENLIRAVCDRFAGQLAFVVLRDQCLARSKEEPITERLREMIFLRLAQAIRPAREHGLVVGFCSAGTLLPYLAGLHAAGFGLIQSIDARPDQLAELAEAWQGKLVFSGGFPAHLLEQASPDLAGAQARVEAQVQAYFGALANRPGVIFGVSPAVTAQVRPELYLAMVQAIRRNEKNEPVG